LDTISAAAFEPVSTGGRQSAVGLKFEAKKKAGHYETSQHYSNRSSSPTRRPIYDIGITTCIGCRHCKTDQGTHADTEAALQLHREDIDVQGLQKQEGGSSLLHLLQEAGVWRCLQTGSG
jgi:hypothetical protein